MRSVLKMPSIQLDTREAKTYVAREVLISLLMTICDILELSSGPLYCCYLLKGNANTDVYYRTAKA